MTVAKQRLLQAVGVGMFLGVAAGTAANGNPFGAVTWVLAVAGLALWVAMTLGLRRRAS